MNAEDLKYVNNGVSQDTRMPDMLHPEAVSIDNRSTVKLVSFVGQYAGLLNYHKSVAEQLKREGNWDFFTHHPVFRLAEIAGTDLTENRQNIDLAADVLQDPNTSSDNKIYAIRLLFDTSFHLFSLINKWLDYGDELSKEFSDDLVKIVKKNLAPVLDEARGYAFVFEKNSDHTHYVYFDEKKLAAFNNEYWQKTDPSYLSSHFENAFAKGVNNLADIIHNAYPSVTEIARAVLYNANVLITMAGEQFDSILTRHNDLKPDLGLLLAFLKLFRYSQQKQNLLTGQHLDFYYRNILKMMPAPVVADSAFLVMQLTPGASDLIVSAGTAFDAGKDSAGNTIVFNATCDTCLTQVQVADLRTSFIASTPILLPADKERNPVSLITGMYSAVQPVPITAGFPVIGEDQFLFSETQQTMQSGNTGFAISSPALFLGGGTRKVSFTLQFTDSFSTQFTNFVLAVSQKTTLTKADTDYFFSRIFTDAFSVSATGLKGWFDLNVTELNYSLVPGKASLTVTINMDTTVQAVTAYNPLIHGTAYSTPYPVVNFLIVPTFPYTAYNFLNNVLLTGISISCDVDNFKNITLSNQNSPVDPTKPAQLLGMEPDLGAYLLIGSNELFLKSLTEIDITIDWQTLPASGNFTDYYQAYNTGITNSSFKLSPSFLVNGKWLTPAVLPAELNMYTELPVTSDILPPPPAQLKSTSVYTLAPLDSTLAGTSIDPSLALVLPVYNQNTQNGFIRLQLSAPQNGFGSSLYTNLLTATVLNNSKIQSENVTINTSGGTASQQITPEYAQQLPLPNRAFTPVSKSIALHYKSTDFIDLSPSAKMNDDYSLFYHIDLFTTYAAKPLSAAATIDSSGYDHLQLLPAYSPQGNLYIGLSNVSGPGELTLLLQLSDKTLDASISEPPVVKWSYLSSDEWKDFVPGSDMDDGTNGLIKCGIVTLTLHEDITSVNTIMPAELCWLRVQVSDQFDVFGNLSAIYTQVIEVTYNGQNTQQRGDVTLPAFSISKAINPIALLKSVTQPFASTGGIAAEDNTAFYTRVSEHLRHKKRAIIPWDYERIVLQQFPQIYKAKCIAASGQAQDTLKPGNIDLVVIPKVDPNISFTITNAQPGPVFGFTTMEEIKQYLQPYMPVHASVTIRNPVYERLIVKCFVKFAAGSVFSLKKLNEDISSFLSPWINGNQIAYNIGDGLQKSTILAFIQHLPYVDFVTGFSVIKIAEVNGLFNLYDSATPAVNNAHGQKGNDQQQINSADFLYALTPYSVFASAQQHLLTELDEIKYMEPSPVGLGDIGIGSDYILTPSNPVSTPNNYYVI